MHQLEVIFIIFLIFKLHCIAFFKNNHLSYELHFLKNLSELSLFSKDKKNINSIIKEYLKTFFPFLLKV
jgi:hypothetical protein